MTSSERLAMLEEWGKTITTGDKACDELLKPLMISPDSPLYAAIWDTQAAYTGAVSDLVGDQFGWLSWFSSENEMGARGFQASPGSGKPSRQINIIADLAKLIEESL